MRKAVNNPLTVTAVASLVLFLTLANANRVRADGDALDPSSVPAGKQTTLGLYLTAKGAYERWKADPGNVKIIDVRTPEEYIYVGHPGMAWNVPLKFIEYKWDAQKKKPVMRTNPNFLAQVKDIVQPGDTILVTCRSGQRSAPAVNILAEAGFKGVYSVIDGVEGDKVKDSESPNFGKRAVNGWKNAGLPWTYDLDPKLMYLPETVNCEKGRGR
jgi:rhodanese-related sulfurtransferase